MGQCAAIEILDQTPVEFLKPYRLSRFMTHPDPIHRLLAGYRTTGENHRTRSQSEVYRYTRPGAPDLFLKIDRGDEERPLIHEKTAMDWLRGKLPTPHVVAYHKTETREYLLTTRIPGRPSHDTTDKARTVRLLAEGLRNIHAVALADCPLDLWTADALIALAESNVASGRVTAETLARRNDPRVPIQALAEIHALKPACEDRVFTHGDYCLPNIMIDEGRLTGFLDWGSAGIGDRHRDFISVAYSIRRNFGEEWIAPFFDAYGREHLIPSALDFYRAIYELT